jgi:hypothetical protein
MTNSYTATFDIEHIHVALQSYWPAYIELKNEVASFKPRPLSEFDDDRKKLFDYLAKLNPESPEERLKELAAGQVAANRTPAMQFSSKFADRIMTLYLTVTLLSQALCEAEINAVLATGFHTNGMAEKFKKFERKELKEKWLEGPKEFRPSYELSKESALYETLEFLTPQRNAWIHHKIQLSVDDKTVIQGSTLHRGTYQELLYWVGRFFSLPYDLAEHALRNAGQTILTSIIYRRMPVEVAEAHREGE